MQKTILTFIILTSFSLGFSQTDAAPGPVWNSDPESTIKGRVLDLSTGEPVSLATVKVIDKEEAIAGAYTDENGYYFISGIKPGTYMLEISNFDYDPYNVEGVILKQGQTTIIDARLDEIKPCICIEEVIVTEPEWMTSDTFKGWFAERFLNITP